MQDMTTDVQTIAGEAYEWFERRTRDDDTSYVTLKDGRPEWIYDAVYAAHGDMLPDDRIFDLCRDAFGFIHDNGADGDIGDMSHDFADQAVDVYTMDRLRWVASHLDRVALCDEAADEYGADAGGIVDRIGLGQYVEAQNAYWKVYRACEERASERDAA